MFSVCQVCHGFSLPTANKKTLKNPKQTKLKKMKQNETKTNQTKSKQNKKPKTWH